MATVSGSLSPDKFCSRLIDVQKKQVRFHHWYKVHKASIHGAFASMVLQASDVVTPNKDHYIEVARREKTTVVFPPGCRDEW